MVILKKIWKITRGDLQTWMPFYKHVMAFPNAGWKVRLPVLAVLTIWMIVKCFLFVRHIAIPQLMMIIRGGDFTQVWCMIYIPVFLLIGAFCLIMTLLALAAGKPQEKPRLPSFMHGHPLITFLIFGAVIFVVSTLIPTVIADLFFNFERVWDGSKYIPEIQYVYSSALLALCLGLFWADINASRDTVHWWTAPFFLLPFSWFGFFPLLWWNFVAYWFPSKYWKLWRIPLTIATCCLPLLAYGQAQRIRSSSPVYYNDRIQEMDTAWQNCYEVMRPPGKTEFFITCINLFRHYKMDTDGNWNNVNETELLFPRNEMSLDFEEERVYIHNTSNSTVEVLDLKDFSAVDQIPVPVERFPVRDDLVHQAYDPKSNTLVVAGSYGEIYVLDVDKREVTQSFYLKTRDKYLQLLMDDSGNLLILGDRCLLVLDPEKKRIINHLSLANRAGGMDIDSRTGKIYIAFPLLMAVHVFDKETMEFERQYPAPLGVRNVRVDSANNIMVTDSISGSAEARALDTGELIRRDRVVVWAHWIELFPEIHQAVITGGTSNSVIWKYLPASSKSNLNVKIEMSLERLWNFIDDKMKLMRKDVDYKHYDSVLLPEIVRYHGRIAIVGAPEKDLQYLKATLIFGGYNAEITTMRDFINQPSDFGSVDAFIVEMDDEPQLTKQIIKIIKKHYENLKIVYAVRDNGNCPLINPGSESIPCILTASDISLAGLEPLLGISPEVISSAFNPTAD